MSNVSALNEFHMDRSLIRKSQTTNDSIIRKSNEELSSLSGSTYRKGETMEVQIQSAYPVLPKNIRLHGDLKFIGDYASQANLKLQDGAHSLIEKISVDFNTQNVVVLNKNAQMVAFAHKLSNYSQEQRATEDKLSLVNTGIPSGANTKPFSLDLSVYGLEIPYLMPTGSGNKLTFRIDFEPLLKNVFYGAQEGANETLKTVTDYEITNCYLSCDLYTLTPRASGILRQALLSDTGASYPLYAYNVNVVNVLPSTTQQLLIPQSYRNVISNVYIPRQTVVNNNSGIPTLNPLTNVGLSYTDASNLPIKATVSFSGAPMVNINGSKGQSGAAQHLKSLVNVSKKNLDDTVAGNGWASLYPSAVFGATWLKGDEKIPEIINSGYNGYLSGGQCDVVFDLETAPNANTQLITVMEFTRVLKISRNGVKIEQ